MGPFGELMTEDDLNRIEKQIENLQVMHKVSEVERELEELERELHQLLPALNVLSSPTKVNPNLFEMVSRLDLSFGKSPLVSKTLAFFI